jgi:spermidine synthase
MVLRSQAPVRLVLAAFLFSGAAALIYEVVWTRALSLVLGSTTHAVSTMLATFMAGLALGAWIGGRLADRSRDPLLLFGACEVGIGLSGILSLPLIWVLPRFYLGLYRAFHLDAALFFTLQIALCALVMLLPTTLMGATFPLVSRAITGRMEELGRKVGSAYSLNTVGAVAGSLVAGFLLIPRLGMRGTVLAAGLLNLVVGLIFVLRSRRAGMRIAAAVAMALYLPVGAWAWEAQQTRTLFSFYSAHRYLDDTMPFARIVARDAAALEPLFEGDYPEGHLIAYRDGGGHLLLQVGGKIEGTATRDMDNTLLLAYLPVAAHGSPESMLVIGLGAGVTLAAAREHVERVELVEIHPGVLEAVSRHGPPGLLEGVDVARNDARNHLLRSARRWDVISSEPSYPTDPVVSNLFTREFFELAADRLSPGGVFCQWLPYHMLTNDDVTLMVKTFASVFPQAMLWKATDGLDLILLGSREPFSVGPSVIQARVEELNGGRWPLNYRLSRSPDEIAEISAQDEVPINTDDRPILEFRVARNLRVGNLALLEGGGDASATSRAAPPTAD